MNYTSMKLLLRQTKEQLVARGRGTGWQPCVPPPGSSRTALPRPPAAPGQAAAHGGLLLLRVGRSPSPDSAFSATAGQTVFLCRLFSPFGPKPKCYRQLLTPGESLTRWTRPQTAPRALSNPGGRAWGSNRGPALHEGGARAPPVLWQGQSCRGVRVTSCWRPDGGGGPWARALWARGPGAASQGPGPHGPAARGLRWV